MTSGSPHRVSRSTAFSPYEVLAAFQSPRKHLSRGEVGLEVQLGLVSARPRVLPEPGDGLALLDRHGGEPVPRALDPAYQGPADLVPARLYAEHVVENHPDGVDGLYPPPELLEHLGDSHRLIPVARPSLDVP